ncbi:glycosyltransferase [Qipengyuania zhejiangensis]|uniref:glycosyltransferase n=1 Tax=Qipengyuania zhejiangensis TaxID=3077782 RepID=UPI002D767A51|nr:glycosyltransferase [Qipengyuania sp. Z2]
MIFLTLGTQLPFDRLVRTLDDVAGDLAEDVFGQIGRTDLRPANFPVTQFLTPTEFAARMEQARVIVGHAGIGTILTGMRMHKPLVLMARRASLGEHRNDHQSATVAQVRKIAGITIVEDAAQMKAALSRSDIPAMSDHGSTARAAMIDALRSDAGLDWG